MVTLSTIEVNPNLSPRVARVDSSVEEIVLQDYVDTLRELEDDFQNMSFPIFINATGKQDLGGGLLVAITVEELNLNLAFNPDKTSDESGTITTASGPPNSINRQRVIDNTADFVTAGIRPGSLIVNFTDQSVTDVIQVISATELEVEALEDGTDNQFELGDVYKVWTVDQKRTAGGNLVAVDDVGASIPAILPTAFTQVVQATSSSATIQELVDIQFSSYDGGVTINESTGIGGTAFPIGTRRQPVSNWVDALSIALTVGLNRFYLETNSTVPESLDLSDNKQIIGDGATVITLTIPASVNTQNLRILDVTLNNSFLDDLNLVERSVINNCTISAGFYFQTAFTGTNTMEGTGQINIFDCYSGVAGGGPDATPEFIVGDAVVAGRGWIGGVEFKGKSGTGAFSWDMTSGRVIVADDNLAGTMTFRGDGTWDNKATYAGTTVVDDQMKNNESIAAAVWNALVATYNTAGTFGQYVGRRLLTTAKFLGLNRDA